MRPPPSRPPETGRPFFRSKEVDRMAVECLRAAGLLPASPSPVRIERFVEKHFGLGAVTYDDLAPTVLGCTVFEGGEVREILVSRRLCDDPSKVAERRLFSTLAHEAGHGIMHASLFANPPEPSLFDGSRDVETDRMLCRDEAIASSRHRSRWWEVQANMMIGSLLLPAPLVHAAMAPFMEESVLGVRELAAAKRHAVSLALAELFDVNPIVAQIRLDGLYPAADAGQLTL
jgi:L-rhamnose mutarotase